MESEEEFIEEGEKSPGNSKTSDNDTVTESCLQNSWDTISSPFRKSGLKAAWHAVIFNAVKRKRGIL